MQQSQNSENDEEEEEDKGDTQRLYSLHLAKILRGDRTKIEMKHFLIRIWPENCFVRV